MKYTPGPWNIETGAAAIVITHESDGLRSHVAKLHDMALCPEHGDIMANARLIAAAPELLEALKQIAGLALGETPYADLAKHAVTLAKAAIAEVEGE